MPTIIPIPAFTDNYIWLLRNGHNAVVVDPGDAAPVLAVLAREQLQLTAILTTHHHQDHVGGNTALLAHARVPVFGPARESIPGCTQRLKENDTFVVPGIGIELRVLDIPGHTAGHIAYVGQLSATSHLAFVGDTMFACGCGRLFEGTAAQMSDSLAKLAALDGDTLVYCGHEYTLSNLRFAAAVEPGNASVRTHAAEVAAVRARSTPSLPSTVGLETRINPFLRSRRPDVRAAASAHAGRPLSDDADAFAAVREWKNGFKG